ncbi:hypothetical protein M9458_053717 [Cirrhinus mrigala]|uniref:Gypsy retrotransposon integrase-like protein 1 n=1 Tax=Cirrhinus mrigala TaxID=683832 RepID=A0ABD0MPU0_CIRMR
MQPQRFRTDRAKVAFLISLLSGCVLSWARALWQSNSPLFNDLKAFTAHFKEVFSTSSDELSTSNQLFCLRQGSSSVGDYTLTFRTLAASSGWNETALMSAYRLGLNTSIRQQIAIFEDTMGLETLLRKTVQIAQRLSACDSFHNPAATSPVSTTNPPTPEPMQEDTYHLSGAECQRHITQGLCLYCGSDAHLLAGCPIRPTQVSASSVRLPSNISQLTPISVQLLAPSLSVPAQALIDSGSSGNFISVTTLQKLALKPNRLTSLFTISTIRGEPLEKGRINHCSPVIRLRIVESRPTTKSTFIPKEYRAFQDVFSKKAATQLPPHRPWDCAIDLLPGATLPKARIYPLPIPEQKAMDDYIKEALQQGFSHPSTSPAASSFFFVGKKDAGLRPCIDYRCLNSQTVKFPYPLPLNFMNEAFREFLHRFVIIYIDDILIYSRDLAEHRRHVMQVLQRLRKHQLFFKAEKCEFYQSTIQFLGYVISPAGIQMDLGKVDSVRDWPQPLTVKELQRFLGFANFYRRFIHSFSHLTAPLTTLLRGQPKTLTWIPGASEAFAALKRAFSEASTLVLPDPSKPFTVEVSASTVGAGAVLSQYSGEPPSLHPCAFFSKKLSPTKKNYDVGNRELLAVKLALEEWRHWLEGAAHPFQIITDHRNLEYIREAKRLNPRQIRWALLFSRFNFIITYRPRSKNIKADALSRLHQPDLPSSSDPILPPNLIVSPIIWEIDQRIQETAALKSVPLEGPEGKTYVPPLLRHSLLDSVHSSLGSGHPGSKRTLSLLRSQYWWPKMAQKSVPWPTHPDSFPRESSCPFPVPTRPWTHIGVDFIADLPSSESLPRKPSSPRSSATSDYQRRLVWKAFFKLLNVSINLSSGYRPQTNGQAEWKIQELGRYLWAYCSTTQHGWSRYLPWAEQSTTGLTPFQCVLGYQPPPFPWSEEPANVPAVDHWFQESEHNAFADTRRAPAPTYHPGDKVWLSTRDIHLRLPCKKLSPRFIGPFTILHQVNPVTYRLELPSHFRIHPTFHVSLLKPYTQPLLPSSADPDEADVPPPPPPEIIADSSLYSVNDILGSRRRGGRHEYLVDWEGYSPEERSLVPRDDILDPTLLTDFHLAHPDRPAPRPRGRPRRRLRASLNTPQP